MSHQVNSELHLLKSQPMQKKRDGYLERDPYRSQPKMTQFQRNLWTIPHSAYIPEMKTEIDLLVLLACTAHQSYFLHQSFTLYTLLINK